MLAGTWILALMPLMDVLKATGWAAFVPVPNVLGYGAVRNVGDTLASDLWVYPELIFCIGVVLLFSRERGRRPARLDWTLRWGVLCAYIALLLNATKVLFICALVLVGIVALFLAMPLEHQPAATPLFVDVSAAYLSYGPYPAPVSSIVLVGFSSMAVLLACIPLFDALRSSGPKRVAAILLAPLALLALMHLTLADQYCIGLSGSQYGAFSWPQLPVAYILDDAASIYLPWAPLRALLAECLKWCVVLAIAVWLSIAQFASWRPSPKTVAP
jgi:hypothetical protein